MRHRDPASGAGEFTRYADRRSGPLRHGDDLSARLSRCRPEAAVGFEFETRLGQDCSSAGVGGDAGQPVAVWLALQPDKRCSGWMGSRDLWRWCAGWARTSLALPASPVPESGWSRFLLHSWPCCATMRGRVDAPVSSRSETGPVPPDSNQTDRPHASARVWADAQVRRARDFAKRVEALVDPAHG
jgi:hypothetical protein